MNFVLKDDAEGGSFEVKQSEFYEGDGSTTTYAGNPDIEDDNTLFANVGLDLGDDKEFYMFGNYSERDITGGFYYRNPHTRGSVYLGQVLMTECEMKTEELY
ncbi:MAG: iron complex outermembrane receptor protein [Paraglaciecola sp.]|jgi:iron complex outermembrane receptor protein